MDERYWEHFSNARWAGAFVEAVLMDIKGHTVTLSVQKQMCWTGCFAKIKANGGICSAGNLSFKRPNLFPLGTCQFDFQKISVIFFWWDHNKSTNVNWHAKNTVNCSRHVFVRYGNERHNLNHPRKLTTQGRLPHCLQPAACVHGPLQGLGLHVKLFGDAVHRSDSYFHL